MCGPGFSKRIVKGKKEEAVMHHFVCLRVDYRTLYNNQINARALIGQSAVVYCAGKPTEKSRVF